MVNGEDALAISADTPKGQKPRGKLVSRLDIVETQYKRGRPYGETLTLLGMAEKGNARARAN